MIAKHFLLGTLCYLTLSGLLIAQENFGKAVEFLVERPNQQLEMIVNTSRILKLEKQVPRAIVNDQSVVVPYPISPNQIQLSAKKAGITEVNLWDEDGELYTVDVIVIGDARELELMLKTQFPQASLRVTPISTSVILDGRVDRQEVVSRIVQIAQTYYPKVINNITVGGVQQVLLNVKVMEVSRTKLRSLGIDWANIGNTDVVSQSVSGLIGSVSQGARSVVTNGTETLTLGLFSEGNAFFLIMQALADNNLAKIMAEPKLVTVSGRPASFNAGGEFPILVPQSLGTIAIEYKEFGTRVDFVPIVMGNGHIRLEVRPQVSELDAANGVTINGERVPALRTRWVDTAVEMRAGQTLALAGLIQTRVETQRTQFPLLGDLPWIGIPFRKVQDTLNEVELVVTVTPQLVSALDPHEVPPCGPGSRTTRPSDAELYGRAYLEVPNCCPDGTCSDCQGGSQPIGGNAVREYEIPAPNNGGQMIHPNHSSSVPAGMIDGRFRQSMLNPAKSQRSIGSSSKGNFRAVSAEKRQIRKNVNFRTQPTKDDPGLFGPVGYDVLDYKE